MWKKDHVEKKGQQYNDEHVQEVVNRIVRCTLQICYIFFLHFQYEISKTCVDKESSPNDVLTQALGTQEGSGRVHGVSEFVTPTTYFHIAKCSKKQSKEIEKLSQENEKLRLQVKELEDIHISTQSTPTSGHGSCSKPSLEYGNRCKNKLKKEKMNVMT